MNKMRAIVFMFLCLLGYGYYFLLSHELNPVALKVGLYSVMGIFSSAFVIILLSSFFRIKKSPNGILCYDPQNLYWRVMKSIWANRWDTKVSLCKMFWLTIAAILGGLMYIVVVAVCIVFIGALGVGGYFLLKYASVLNVMFWSLGIVSGLGILAVISYLVYLWMRTFSFKTREMIGIIASVVFLGFALVGLPIGVIIENGHSLSQAIFLYLKWTSIIVGVLVGTCFLIAYAIKYIPMLKDTFLGIVYTAIKTKTCPILYECSFEGKNK